MKTTDASAGKARPSARAVALDILLAVTAEARLIAEIESRRLADLPPAEAARARRLAVETLRWGQRADRMIGRHIRQRPPEDVLNTLRLGAYEMHVSGEAPHGVVSSLVSLTRTRTKEPGLARMVNAVLRKIAVAEDWERLPVPELPKPLRKRLVSAYGKARVAGIEAVHATVPPLDLTPRGDAADLAGRVGGEALPTGSVRLAGAGRVSALPGYDGGDWWVQDAAAALPARLLGVAPGKRVLDLCAAPGGKTMQLAAMGAKVTALDVSDTRLDVLRENLSRTRLAAEIVVADALDWSGGPFDRVLLDAPCSASGTIRRHPDLPYAKRDLDLGPLIELQDRLLARALDMLKPGGTLIYCTCSLFPDEGEDRIAAVLASRAGVALDPIAPDDAPGLEPDWFRPDGTLRITPETWAGRGGIDGFFIARLELAGSAPSADDRRQTTG